MIGVIALVADQAPGWRSRGDKRGRAPDVGDMTAGQEDGVRTAFRIDERVNLRRASAA